jgi:hypothetical protein
VPIERLRQGIAKSRTSDVERVAQRTQRIADAARCRRFLVKNDQDRQQIGRGRRECGTAAREGQDVVAILVRPERHRRCSGTSKQDHT